MQEHLPCVDWERFLVYLTKRSTSLFPAAVVHSVTNLLPALVDSDAAVFGHYQRASCSDTDHASVFLCAVGTGNRSLSVYPIWGIIHAASFI